MKSNLMLFVIFILLIKITCAKICSVKDYGAKGDGATKDTAAIQAAIKDCAGANSDSVNTLLFPSDQAKGKYLTGSIELTANLQLKIEDDAVILGSEDLDDQPLIDPLPSQGIKGEDRLGGPETTWPKRYRALIFGSHCDNIRIYGGGTIDGQGGVWWLRHHEKKLKQGRPYLVEIMFTKGIRIENVHLKNSAFWTTHPQASQDIIVQNVTISAPVWAPNTDGIDVDSCNSVLIRDCNISVGDDAIAIKSGLNKAGRDFNKPSHNIRIENITMEHNGIAIGSEMSGGVYDVTVDGADFNQVTCAIQIKSRRGRGGLVSDIHFTNIRLKWTLQAIRFSMDQGSHTCYTHMSRYNHILEKRLNLMEQMKNKSNDYKTINIAYNNDDETPHFRNFFVENLTAEGVLCCGDIIGLDDSIIENVSLKNIQIKGKLLKWHCNHATITADNVNPPLPDECIKNDSSK